MNRFYVDVDGTLLSSRLDKKWMEWKEEYGFEVALEKYEGLDVDDLVVNGLLVDWLRERYEDGDEIVVWTNRGEGQREMTRRNLSCIEDIVSEWRFREGGKSKDRLMDGWIIDNDLSMDACCDVGRFIPAFWE